jgi:hypothetical protein
VVVVSLAVRRAVKVAEADGVVAAARHILALAATAGAAVLGSSPAAAVAAVAAV